MLILLCCSCNSHIRIYIHIFFIPVYIIHTYVPTVPRIDITHTSVQAKNDDVIKVLSFIHTVDMLVIYHTAPIPNLT